MNCSVVFFIITYRMNFSFKLVCVELHNLLFWTSPSLGKAPKFQNYPPSDKSWLRPCTGESVNIDNVCDEEIMTNDDNLESKLLNF